VRGCLKTPARAAGPHGHWLHPLGHVPFTGATHIGVVGVLDGTVQQSSPVLQQLVPQQKGPPPHATMLHGGEAAQLPLSQ
jgi:hypothetical protein